MKVFVYTSGIMLTSVPLEVENLTLDDLIQATSDYMTAWTKRVVDNETSYSLKFMKFVEYENQFRCLERRTHDQAHAGRKSFANSREFNYSLNRTWTQPLALVDGKIKVLGTWHKAFMYEQPRYADSDGNVVRAYHFTDTKFDPVIEKECGITRVEKNDDSFDCYLGDQLLLGDEFIVSKDGTRFFAYSRKDMHEKYPYREWMMSGGFV
ncbi:hypothetical protein [Companilactobacillus nodensis]|nr:hypothetical protein [Companilactobacillus nodensis]